VLPLFVVVDVIAPVFLLSVKPDELPRTLVISKVADFFLTRKYRQMSTTNAGASGNTAGSGQITSPVKTNNVQVSLRVNVDVSGNVDVFTTTGNQVNNVVVCAQTLAHGDLYTSPTNAILEFWEPSDRRGDISGAVAGGAGAGSLLSAPTTLASLVTDLAAVILGAMDASGAAPFNAASYVANSQHRSFDNFGELALAAHAHYLFGHVAATTAIDNDLALINYFKGNTGSGDAQIATLLKNALQALSAADATTIVKQVISQDPSRATGQDNNALVPDVHQGLLFASGDIVYMQVTIKQPSITSGSSSAAPGAGSSNNLPSGSGSAFPSGGAVFTLKITLA